MLFCIKSKNAAINYWAKIQNKDGSFSEWYPNEHTYGPTAFGIYAISETLLILGEEIENHKDIIINLRKSADWLINHEELRVQNQECGAVAALYNMFILTKDKSYESAAKKKIVELQEQQKEE